MAGLDEEGEWMRRRERSLQVDRVTRKSAAHDIVDDLLG
jgi:hypothetical protein